MRTLAVLVFLCLSFPAAFAATLDDSLRQGEEALARRDVVAAMTAFTAALEADPRTVKAAYERGRLLLLIGEPGKAVADFTTAILGDPAFGRAYVGRAEAKLALKDGKSAIADFDKAIAVAPGDFEVHVSRAAFRLKIGNLGGARADLEAARAVADPATAARLGEMLARLGGE